MLIEKLAHVGLEVHDEKTKIITSDIHNAIDFVNISDKLIEVVDCEKSHKYLGKFLNATSIRSHLELQHRIKVAWHSFHKHRRWLLNRNVPIQLRLRLFSSVVTPSALFATSMLSLTRTQLDRLGSVQRKMLRNIVGWVRVDGEEWETTMRRMKQQMNDASRQFFIMPWELQVFKSQWQYAIHVSHASEINWVEMISRWHPPATADLSLPQQPKRSVGRPRARWDDAITSFAATTFDDSLHWIDTLHYESRRDLLQLSDAFSIHCNIF